jgi:hypothetical protein
MSSMAAPCQRCNSVNCCLQTEVLIERRTGSPVARSRWMVGKSAISSGGERFRANHDSRFPNPSSLIDLLTPWSEVVGRESGLAGARCPISATMRPSRRLGTRRGCSIPPIEVSGVRLRWMGHRAAGREAGGDGGAALRPMPSFSVARDTSTIRNPEGGTAQANSEIGTVMDPRKSMAYLLFFSRRGRC